MIIEAVTSNSHNVNWGIHWKWDNLFPVLVNRTLESHRSYKTPDIKGWQQYKANRYTEWHEPPIMLGKRSGFLEGSLLLLRLQQQATVRAGHNLTTQKAQLMRLPSSIPKASRTSNSGSSKNIKIVWTPPLTLTNGSPKFHKMMGIMPSEQIITNQ